VYAIKGMAGPGRPVWPKRSSKGMAGKAVLFLVLDGALSGDAPVVPLIDKRTAAALQNYKG
jgi:hypothetical protein